jgi:glycosyltransferase involved in cell wall biosynthesis
VLVSKNCGCVSSLVREGENGFTFDPHDIQAVAALMLQMAESTNLSAMGRAGTRIIENWGPSRFADGLVQAAEHAVARGPARAGVGDLLLHRMLAAVTTARP